MLNQRILIDLIYPLRSKLSFKFI